MGLWCRFSVGQSGGMMRRVWLRHRRGTGGFAGMLGHSGGFALGCERKEGEVDRW